jgi:hypothetical protein
MSPSGGCAWAGRWRLLAGLPEHRGDLVAVLMTHAPRGAAGASQAHRPAPPRLAVAGKNPVLVALARSARELRDLVRR